MRIALDVMGGDHGCGVVLEGAQQALQSLSAISKLFLVGDETEIRAGLNRLRCHDSRLQIVHAFAELLGTGREQ